ncbi:type II toxin-antitoxin system PemK/MazF family toxin [Alkalihalobacillus oceani]|uniref:type II toxin-antitoxin system PemK/MazF family toxin n=1 Tax=Halalkalibacter oceani TaxID=1653776 RepID=UPI00204038A1|nr:type II toxin-antitoxin system PemK/MazF family toxin [Halalkalibacter oceani]MCM3761020.1 type II toxin-antitoxin system PemK/MazF family toxin [Halalkalibacter oceani]
MVRTYNARDDLKDSREFSFGDIWKLRDELITLLPTDRIDGKRKLYPSRTVVVVQNCLENNDEESLIIEVAPLTTTTRFLQKFDVLLHPNEGEKERDNVKEECMAQIHLSQPMLKKDMYEKVGEISTEKKEEIAAIKLNLLGIDIDNLE